MVVACGREFTLIATKPYIGPSREALERAEQEDADKAERLQRQLDSVHAEQKEQLARIRRDKVVRIVEHLNAGFPKCSICKLGIMCPGYQRDPMNPSLCRHCLHDRKQHDDLHDLRDNRVTLAYLEEVQRKLDISVDCSDIRDIELEEELAEQLEQVE